MLLKAAGLAGACGQSNIFKAGVERTSQVSSTVYDLKPRASTAPKNQLQSQTTGTNSALI